MSIFLNRFISKKFSRSGKRQRFLNFARTVALFSVTLGSMALIISLSVLDGFESMLKENAVKFTSHISLRAFDNRNVKIDETAQTLQAIKHIKSFAPIIQREGLIKTKSYIEGVLIQGFNPKYDITDLRENIKDGVFNFSSDTSSQIIIGKRLAVKLNSNIGDSVFIFAVSKETNGVMSYPDIEKFRITGIYETGMAQYDDIYVYIPFKKSAQFFKMPENSASSIDIMLDEVTKAPAVAKTIEDLLGFPYFCYTVYDLHKAIFTWIEYQKAPIPLVLGLISIVAVLNIITILLITVVEKTHSIGILRALGMKKSGIISIFVFQGTAIGLTGTLLGCGIGFLLCWLQLHFSIIKLEGNVYFLDVLPIKLSLWHYEIVIGISILLSVLATFVPSFIASKISPIRAIRFK